MCEVSTDFWNCCDQRPSDRARFEIEAHSSYKAARDSTWIALNAFCEEVANDIESPSGLKRWLRRKQQSGAAYEALEDGDSDPTAATDAVPSSGTRVA
jgi:hypothetical protein